MGNRENKQIWVKPSVQVLNIKKDTFSGSNGSDEGSNGNNPFKNASGHTNLNTGSTRRGR